jgi:L-lactate utilization protein LutC
MSETDYNSMSRSEILEQLKEKRSEIIDKKIMTREKAMKEYKLSGKGIDTDNLANKLKDIDIKLKNYNINTNYFPTLPDELQDKILDMVSESNSISLAINKYTDLFHQQLEEEAALDSYKYNEPNEISNSDLRERIKKRIERFNNTGVPVKRQIQKHLENVRLRKEQKKSKKEKKELRTKTRKQILNRS